MFLRYCTRCVLPSTRPDVFFDEEGICPACNQYERRSEIDWDSRFRELKTIMERYRSKDGSNYDCIIPSSGGKDSTYQVIKVKELGLNPIAVTASTCRLSEIGRRNIENIKNLGVDCIEVSVDPIVRRKMNRLCLREVGDIQWPEHVRIFTIPVRMALRLNIPLIIWGENSQNEFGGPGAAAENNILDRGWLEEFGGLIGLRVSDLIGQEGIEKSNLIQYTYPTDEELKAAGIVGLFLGQYLPWDGYSNAMLAIENGFETYHKPVEGAVFDYENLDNLHHGIHDYFKFLKFGFGRATDHASLGVRRGRFTREEALELVKKHDGKFPWEYLGHTLDEILEEIDMTVDEFIKICDRFTNKKLFLCDNMNKLIKDDDGNLAKINYDNKL